MPQLACAAPCWGHEAAVAGALTSPGSSKTPRLPLQRLIETASWGEDPAAIEQQLVSHQRFHTSIQRSAEVDRARDELVSRRHGDQKLTVTGDEQRRAAAPVQAASFCCEYFCCLVLCLQMKKGDRGNVYALDQEWDSLQVNQQKVQELNLTS